jgi:hypothetical protein
VVNPSLASLVVHVKVLQVVVEIDASRAEVSAEQGRVGGEDGGHVDMALSAQRNGQTGLPFVEVGNDGLVGLASCELGT